MRIKELRLERNLTQSEVAKAIGTSQRNIGRWENGENEPAAVYVKALAEFFGVRADYLLGLEDDFGIRVDSKELIKRPDYDITDKQLTDFMKLFKVMTEVQKAQVLGFVIGMLENAGVNVKAVLGY